MLVTPESGQLALEVDERLVVMIESQVDYELLDDTRRPFEYPRRFPGDGREETESWVARGGLRRIRI